MIGLLGALEAAATFTSLADRLTDALAVIVSGAVGYWAMRRYLYLLNHAEFVASQADCPHCGVYARFSLIGESADQARVRCRACAHEWTIQG
jgi:nitrite reductase/ring-hydroxylating ferredoxin subunit